MRRPRGEIVASLAQRSGPNFLKTLDAMLWVSGRTRDEALESYLHQGLGKELQLLLHFNSHLLSSACGCRQHRWELGQW